MQYVQIRQVTVDIKNPRPDRRSRDWDKLPVIPAGSRFIVHEESIRSAEHRYAWVGRKSDLGKLIEANSDQVGAQSVKELKAIHNCDWSGDEVLRVLLKLGKIDGGHFAAAGEAPEDF
jgi:hypothetical protein